MSGGIIVAAIIAQAQSSLACNCSEPVENELIVGNGRIPADAGGIPWWYEEARSPAFAFFPEFAEQLGEDLNYEELFSLASLEKLEGDEFVRVETSIQPWQGVYLIVEALGAPQDLEMVVSPTRREALGLVDVS